jgi:alkaline phosphatase D
MKTLFSIFLVLAALCSHAATVATNKSVYAPGETVIVSWTGANAAVKDWIGIYKEGQKPSSNNPALDWDYVNANSGNLNFPGRQTGLVSLPPGRYVMVLLCCDGYRVKATSTVFEVTGSSNPSISANKTSYASGEPITFTYSGGTGSPTDWIGIYFKGETPSSGNPAINWKYISNLQGTITFENVFTGGPFVAFLFCCDGYSSIAVSGEFTVAPGTGLCTITSPPAVPDVVTKIAFGSCASQSEPQPTLDVALAKDPDLFIYLGDNMYANTYDPRKLQQFYHTMYGRPEFCRLKNAVPLLATWDDHDYANNDEDKDNPIKVQSQQIFCDFWGEPANSVRRTREGIYMSYLYGTQPGKKLQVILLDTRYFLDNRRLNNGCGKNDYCPITKPSATVLGDAQWLWLEQQLSVPADLRIIASSIPFGTEYNGWETWANFPLQQEKLVNLIKSTGANGVVFISGDVHYSELSAYTTASTGYTLYDFTSSGINREWRAIEPNMYRVPGVPATYNQSFGFFEVDWTNRTLKMSAFGASNNVLFSHTASLNDLRPGGALAAPQSSNEYAPEKLVVYPNPSERDIKIETQTQRGGILQIVNTANGRVVKEIDVPGGQQRYNMSDLSAGLYNVVFRTRNDSFVYSDKLVIK